MLRCTLKIGTWMAAFLRRVFQVGHLPNRPSAPAVVSAL